MNMSGIFKHMLPFVRQHKKSFLLGVSIAGVISSAISAARQAPIAEAAISARCDVIFREEDRHVTIWDKTQVAWKYYIPTASLVGVTILSIVGLHKAHLRDIAVLTAAASLSDNALREYRAVIREKLGEEEESAEYSKSSAAPIREMTLPLQRDISDLGGNILMRDSYSGRLFMGDIAAVKDAINQVNHLLNTQDYASLNDYYGILGLDTIRYGDDVGWNVDDLVRYDLGAHLMKDGNTCTNVHFATAPKHNYFRR